MSRRSPHTARDAGPDAKPGRRVCGLRLSDAAAPSRTAASAGRPWRQALQDELFEVGGAGERARAERLLHGAQDLPLPRQAGLCPEGPEVVDHDPAHPALEAAGARDLEEGRLGHGARRRVPRGVRIQGQDDPVDIAPPPQALRTPSVSPRITVALRRPARSRVAAQATGSPISLV